MDAALRRSGGTTPLVVGDRLDTDIEGAYNGGADSLLVFTGVTDPLMALTAVPEHRPTYLAADLNGLLVDHPETRADGDSYTCAGWTATWDWGHLKLTGEGDPWNGLRALSAAAWRNDTPLPRDAAEKALSQLSF
jgi:hypothetical protein